VAGLITVQIYLFVSEAKKTTKGAQIQIISER